MASAFNTRRATILENNVVQTTGSAGESIAFGVGATMPALMILGYDMEPTRVMMVSVLGGILGILMMIPLRRAFIVKQHGTLPYPEGTACAKILIAGEQGGASARTVFAGFGLAFVYQVFMEVFHLWPKEPAREITGINGYNKAVFSGEVSPALLGVGYIIGTRTASIMVGGGILAALVLTPAIAFFGSLSTEPLAPATVPVSQMGPGAIYANYVRYIGAGAVAAGGIISMLRALPLILGGLLGSFRAMGNGAGGTVEGEGRTGRDMPIWVVAVGSIGLVAAIAASHLIPTDVPGRDRRGLDDPALRLPVRHRQLAAHGRDRLVVEPDLGHDDRHAPAHLLDLRRCSAGSARSTAWRRSRSRRSSASRRRTAARPRRTSRRATSSGAHPGSSRSRSSSGRSRRRS